MKKESKNLKSITERNSNDKSHDLYTDYIAYTGYEITIKYLQYEDQPNFNKKLMKLISKLNLPALIIGPKIIQPKTYERKSHEIIKNLDE